MSLTANRTSRAFVCALFLLITSVAAFTRDAAKPDTQQSSGPAVNLSYMDHMVKAGDDFFFMPAEIG